PAPKGRECCRSRRRRVFRYLQSGSCRPVWQFQWSHPIWLLRLSVQLPSSHRRIELRRGRDRPWPSLSFDQKTSASTPFNDGDTCIVPLSVKTASKNLILLSACISP